MKPNFSVAVLTYNEKDHLPNLLESLSEFRQRGGDVLVLEGGTDGTGAVATALGCRVCKQNGRFVHLITVDQEIELNTRFRVPGDQPFAKAGQRVFDYAAARNHIASLAENEFVAQPDADEVFLKLDIDRVNERTKTSGKKFASKFVFSRDQSGRPGLTFNHQKFYDRRAFKWDEKCIMHEVLRGDGVVETIPESEYLIDHRWNGGGMSSNGLTGMALQQFLHPCARNSHYLGRELFYSGRFLSAIAELESHVAMNEWPTEVAESLMVIGDCYGRLGQESKQVDSYHRSFGVASDRREPLMKLAEFYFSKRDATRTACYASAALHIPQIDYYPTNSRNYGAGPHDLLYWSKFALGCKDEARFHWEKAIAFEPDNQRFIEDSKWFT